MKVFVTGASGFYGSRLVRRLIEEGHEVRSFGRSQALPLQLESLPIEHVSGDIADVDTLRNAMRGIDCVFHLAGLVSYRRSDYDQLHAVNVVGARNVMQAAADANVGRVVHLGSIAGMGIPSEGEIGTEEITYNLRGLGLYYCDTKYEGEQEVLKFARQGLPVVILCPGITFGEGDTHPHHHTIFKSMAQGNIIGYPKGGVTFSDIEDVVQTGLNAMTMGRPGQRYVVGSANLTFREAANTLCEVIGSKPPTFAIPGGISEMAGTLCETVFPLLGLRPVLTRQVAWLSQRNIFFSSAKAIAELGLKQTPFIETIRRTAPYYLHMNFPQANADKQLSLKH